MKKQQKRKKMEKKIWNKTKKEKIKVKKLQKK